MTTPQITDSHCHLDFPDFDEDRDALIARAHEAGVTRMVTICTKLRLEPEIRAIAERYDSVFYAAGTHPMSAADEPMATVEDLVAMAQHPKFVGIGETGLDYHYTADSKQVQQDSLQVHIEAARQTGLPLIIHARAADDDMARILSEAHRAGAFSCVMHCFSSSRALAEAALDLGFYLSMSGISAFPKSQRPIAANAMSLLTRPTPRGWALRSLAWTMPISPRRRRRISSASSPRLPREPAVYDIGLRLVGRRAAHWRALGRMRPGEP